MWHAGSLKYKNPVLVLVTLILVLLNVGIVIANDQPDAAPDTESEAQVIQNFTSKEDLKSDIVKIDDQRKRQIMFAMGVPLLLFIIITVALGVAMGVFGKDVYIAHMIFAGLSLTLALGHAIVGLVWFWPF